MVADGAVGHGKNSCFQFSVFGNSKIKELGRQPNGRLFVIIYMGYSRIGEEMTEHLGRMSRKNRDEDWGPGTEGKGKGRGQKDTDKDMVGPKNIWKI
jgi:hypothetical protein